MTELAPLITILTPVLGWHRARLTFLAPFLVALIRVRTVNLTEIATVFCGTAKPASSSRRMQRFFQTCEMPPSRPRSWCVCCRCPPNGCFAWIVPPGNSASSISIFSSSPSPIKALPFPCTGPCETNAAIPIPKNASACSHASYTTLGVSACSVSPQTGSLLGRCGSGFYVNTTFRFGFGFATIRGCRRVEALAISPPPASSVMRRSAKSVSCHLPVESGECPSLSLASGLLGAISFCSLMTCPTPPSTMIRNAGISKPCSAA